ncbi:hypothetical protein WJX84_006492 [Apatococcus fuscideae]|uniref:Uncharacterized protein n=1 Tax=Apatococcus fuscideae TaxID=2026836 RepID=A0AAW1T175_9CHLO
MQWSQKQDMKEDAVEVEAGGEWDPSSFEHDPVAWMSCGARMRELWKAAEQRFQESWKISAAAPDVGWKLAELYCKAGKPRQAIEVAEEGAEKVPTDADLQALFILLARACGLGSELREKVAQAHLHLLEDDPFCCSAVAGLLEAKAFLDKASMLDALIGHLDVCPKRDCFGWQGLADEIEQQHLDAQNQASQEESQATGPGLDLWRLVQHHRPFCQPLALSTILTRLLEHSKVAPDTSQAGQTPAPPQAHGSSELKTDETMEDVEDEHENAIGLREDVESGLEEVGPRMRCLAFMDAELGARLSGTLQAIGCNEDADAIAALAAFSKALFQEAAHPASAGAGGCLPTADTAGPSFRTAFGSVKRLPRPWWRTFPAYRRQQHQMAAAGAATARPADLGSSIA